MAIGHCTKRSVLLHRRPVLQTQTPPAGPRSQIEGTGSAVSPVALKPAQTTQPADKTAWCLGPQKLDGGSPNL